ncbi:MAG TPA: ABC transporter substrate-binding protein [Candidatus Binatia bacterium]|nr:ABC transporter substrate-binding protein [Candidatus Binatia bacterium]
MVDKIFMVLALLMACIAPGQSARAQERIRIAWAGASPANAAIWVLQEKRLLQKYGVEPEIISINASPTVLQALLAGEIDVSATSVTTLVSSRLAGADTVMILGMVRTFVDHIITAQSISTPEQLKGKIGGVNRIGSTSDMGLRFALRRLNIDPEKDAKIITAGGNPERFAALSKGIIQFTIIPEPFVRQALQLGFRDLFDIGSLKIPFWWNGVLSREAIVKAKRPLLLKFARAMIEAIHFNKTHKEEAKAIWGKNLRISDPEGLERAWHTYTAAYPDNLLPTPEGVKTLLDDIAPREPKAATANPRLFVDPSLVQEIEATGFVKQLYKK